MKTPTRLRSSRIASLLPGLTAATLVLLLLGCSPRTPVLDAAEEGDLNKVKSLLQRGHSINERNSRVKFGWTPLMAAIYQGNTNVAHFLIASGADVDLADNTGETPLTLAMVRGDESLPLVADLIAHGANVNARVISAANSLPPKPKILQAVNAAAAQEPKSK